MGFEHNNCGGGCVRAGKKQWVRLYFKQPDVFKARKEMEINFNKKMGRAGDKYATILKDESLESLEKRIKSGSMSNYYNDVIPDQKECVGICDTEN